MQHITPTQLKQLLDTTEQPPLLLDVREPAEVQICDIPGSVHIPMGEISQSLDRLDPERQIVVICHHGVRSMQVANYLQYHGFENVINLSGGIHRWAIEVDPEMATY